jgi:hypothetical protein
MDDFTRKHSRATLLLLKAAHDYAEARCLLLNGLFGGLAIGAQTIEKLLKAYLLFHDPTRDVKRLSHSLERLLKEADSLEPQLRLSRYDSLVKKFAAHYATRYPDDPAGSTSMTTADLLELDEMVVFLNENLPCPRNVKYRTGMYALITFSLGPGATVTPWERWIKENNRSLAPLVQRINSEQTAVLREIHPNLQK